MTTATDYHQMPGLSSSGARKLLPPSCPAKFRWERDNGQPPKDAFDFGHAAHRFVLGKGADIARLDFPDRRTKAAKEAIAAARADGLVPVLADDYDAAAAMAQALRDSPVADLFTDGEPEVVIEWADPETGTPLRTMFDWLPNARGAGLVVPDYKTAVSASPVKFQRAAFAYGYHVQAAWYLDTLAAVGISDDARFVFVVQEKTPPYLVTPIELDAAALAIGRHECRKAIDLYVRCVETDTWPGYSDGAPVVVSAPAWVEYRYLDEVAPDEIEV